MKLQIAVSILFNISMLQSNETIRFEEDGRTWVFAGKAKTGEATFIPEGDSLEAWKEVLVLLHVPQAKIPLETYYQNFMNALNKKSSGLFNSKILKTDDTSILFEWWMDTDIPNAQHGFIKIFYTDEGLSFMRYSTKNGDAIDKIRPVWEKIFSKYEVDLFPEKIDVKLNWRHDPKNWIQDNAKGVERYLLDDEKNSDPTETVSVEEFTKTPYSLRDFYENDVGALQGQNTDIKARLIFDTTTRMLYEWWYRDRSKNIHEWVFISKENFKAPIIIRHHIASDKNIEDRIRIWEKILKDAKVDATYKYKAVENGLWVKPQLNPSFLKEMHEGTRQSEK